MSALEGIQPTAGVRPIRGPSAFGGDVRRFVHLTRVLAVTDFKLRFFGSMLGYLWQLVRPLMLFGVLYVVFTQSLRLGHGVRFFPVVLLLGIVLFTFYSESTHGSVTSVVDRENLVRKVQFPRLAIPASTVLTACFNLTLNLLVVFVFAFASGVRPGVRWLELPLLLLALTVLASGLAMILSALYVRFRDVKPIWEVVLQVTFYGSPILYPVEQIDSRTVQKLEMLNPLGAIAQQTRHALVDPGAPSAYSVAGGPLVIAVPIALTIGLFVLGLWFFNREAPRIAEEL